ncbi:MAG: Xaa-Pro peptidase family protein [Alphaproteobacteria bacterium]|nr:Xaa-Pro peptidase family protein [Alphaproteobacteria bacterium]MDA8000929.1 Xaa-Pro peptidase family protein [Alphaproteobacteria bacterium]MDA8004791.1 Xaa-Pro peptidase family protein [Alphaproteobacteria bacterium]MDA8005660.1 Xaa-Pro peptidase family protein [Alphaproteobacteria bacterium]MDA8012912.1 Xaa-Pro peptidase family protein [Alphaproteobacteria bacterium]
MGLADWEVDVYGDLDLARLRSYRLERFRAELRGADVAGALLYDPLNIRYATDARNMQVWTLHAPGRYVFVATEGPVILFDYHGCFHICAHLETLDEIRPAIAWLPFSVGEDYMARARAWAEEIADLVRVYGGGVRRLAVDRSEPAGLFCLSELGVEVCDGQWLIERARSVKSAEEVAAVKLSMSACDAALRTMQDGMRAGMSENEVWSLMHGSYIASGGEWIETRFAASGPRTNPWFQECSGRRMEAGELFVFDSDMVGPTGYLADVSRAWLVGDGAASDEQRRLYGTAYEQVHFNLELVRAGLGFREFTEKSWRMPEEYRDNRYAVVAHGAGLCDEYPSIYYAEDMPGGRSEGVLEAGMVLCVESYIGESGGLGAAKEGVKLEQQVLVTDDGYELLSPYPFEDRLLPREV